jgi:hypothetical protein
MIPCMYCGTHVHQTRPGYWVDATGGDGCDNPYGVHTATCAHPVGTLVDRADKSQGTRCNECGLILQVDGVLLAIFASPTTGSFPNANPELVDVLQPPTLQSKVLNTRRWAQAIMLFGLGAYLGLAIKGAMR